MVQTQTIEHVVPASCYRKSGKTTKNIRISKNCVKTTPPNSERTICKATSGRKEKKVEEEHEESNDVKKETHEETNDVKKENREEKRRVTTAVEEIKRRRREERLAKEKQAEEERERFVKEAAERRAAERAEIIKEAKRLIFYRKPMCRRINQGLMVSECLRELDAQLKFRETIKDADNKAEMEYVKMLKEDLAKYEEEMKQKEEKQLEKRRNYGTELKKQIEEIEKATKAKETEEFEAGRQDLINTDKYLMDAKEFEMQKLLNKKQKLNQFFKDAIEEKKQVNLKLEYEDAFEDRAIEVYQRAKERIRKAHKEMILKEKKEKEQKADRTRERFSSITNLRDDIMERSYKRAVEEQEAEFQEKERTRKEREHRMNKELQDFRTESTIAKAKLLQEEKDWRTWELMQRYKRAECDKETKSKERERNWEKKMEYAKSLKKYISEKEAEREEEKLAEDKATNMDMNIIEKENKRVLDYAEEVLNESKDVRPLFPILKAIEDCKKEMGLLPSKKREEILVDTKRKRKRRIPRVCTKFVPEDKILYLK